MLTLQEFMEVLFYIHTCLIVLRLADNSFIEPTTTPIMADHHLECNKLEALTAVQVQNSGQNITYNHNNLIHIKEEMVKDERYKRLDLDTIKTIRKYRLNKRGQRGGQKRQKQGKVDLESFITVNINEDKMQLQANSSPNIKVTLANIQSIRNKELILYDYLQSNDIDICIITKTWLQNCNSDEIWLEMTDLNNNEFKMGVSNRTNQLGGGIAIITKSQLGQHKLDEGQKQSFQYAIWKISTKHDTLTVVVIYHPLYST